MQRWADVHAFRYPGMRLDLSTGVVVFDYVAEAGTTSYEFTDVLTFPLPERVPDPETLTTLGRVLELLYVAVGLSYYKVMAPRSVALDTVRLAPGARRWAEALYRQGMAQFAHRNDLPHVLELELRGESGNDIEVGRDMAEGEHRPLVAFGGGKDSIVSVESLKAAGLRPVLYALRPAALLGEVMALAQVSTLPVRRVLDPRVAPLLNEHGGYKGHVPVTAITSLVGVVTSLLHGLGPVVMSNERSASSANLVWHGQPVNHQWAKSTVAEELLRGALSSHAGLDNGCFSLLSGMSELHIAQTFAGIHAYDSKVTSCNNAYRFFSRNRSERWCGNCAKCRFVFLALAPFLDRARLVGIVGQDLLDDPARRDDEHHVDGYRELLGLRGHKPFECVGEIVESRVALRLLAEDPVWANAALVRVLGSELTSWPSDREVAKVFTATPPPAAPQVYVRALEAMQAAAVPAPA